MRKIRNKETITSSVLAEWEDVEKHLLKLTEIVRGVHCECGNEVGVHWVYVDDVLMCHRCYREQVEKEEVEVLNEHEQLKRRMKELNEEYDIEKLKEEYGY